MEILKQENRPSDHGPEEWFNRTVWMNEIAVTREASPLRVDRVTFEPSARTAWHRHPVDQVLYVLSGIGWVQKDGEDPVKVYPGDSVVIAANERHWHGAVLNQTFVHIAVQNIADDGTEAEWSDHVSASNYPQN